MPRKNDWQQRFGASRRAKDKAYCEAAERAAWLESEMREQLEFEHEKRRRLAREGWIQ
jgi:hypothetical protein